MCGRCYRSVLWTSGERSPIYGGYDCKPHWARVAVGLGFVCLLPGCGSSSSDSGPSSSAGDSGDSSTAGSNNAGGLHGGSGNNEGGDANDAVAGSDGDTAGTSSGGDSGAGTGGAAAGGASAGAGGAHASGGAAGTGPATAGWFCIQAGAACSCIPVPKGSEAANTCTVPMAPCCFTFVNGAETDCECQPTTSLSCTQWLSAIKGTKVSACPPP